MNTRYLQIIAAASIGAYAIGFGIIDIHDHPSVIKYAAVVIGMALLLVAWILAKKEFFAKTSP